MTLVLLFLAIYSCKEAKKETKDAMENVEAMARFVSGLKTIEDVDLLVYHDLAGAKYKKLQRPDLTDRAYTVTPDIVARTRQLLEQHGLKVHLER